MSGILEALTGWLYVNLVLLLLLFLLVPICEGYERQRRRYRDRQRQRRLERARERAMRDARARGVIPLEPRRPRLLQLHGRGRRFA